MSARSLSSRAALLALCFFMSGCSWAFMDKAPAEAMWAHIPPNQYVPCTASRLAPGLDTLFAGGQVFGLLVSSDQMNRGDRMAAALLAGVLSFSAFEGFSRASTCHRFQYTRTLNAYPRGNPMGY